MAPERLDERGLSWRWCGRDIHLMADDNYRLVGAALLAHRDAVTSEEQDWAAVLVWTVEEHPPWDSDCPTCRTDGPCEAQQAGDGFALEYLIRKSTELVRRSRELLAAGRVGAATQQQNEGA